MGEQRWDGGVCVRFSFSDFDFSPGFLEHFFLYSSAIVVIVFWGQKIEIFWNEMCFKYDQIITWNKFFSIILAYFF